MDDRRQAAMAEATRLTREGRLAEATALIQQTLSEAGTPSAPDAPPPGRPPLRNRVRRGLRGLFRRQQPADSPVEPRPEKTLTPGPHVPGALRPPPRAEEAAGRRAPGAFDEFSYRNEAGRRRYLIYVPTGYTGQPVPLIVMLHGGTQTAEDFAAGTRMNELAERDTFLVAYPEQSTGANKSRYWNWFHPGHQQRAVGEPSLIAGITRQVIRDHSVDPRRVYVAGLSAGGAMASVMAATYPDLYAAAGIHSGLRYAAAHDVQSAFAAMRHGPSAPEGPLAAAKPVPLIVFHGDGDTTVDPINAAAILEASRAAASQAAPQALQTITSTAGRVTGGRPYTRTVLGHGGRPLAELWTVHGAGHAWSGGSPDGSYTDSAGPDASAELVRFFREASASLT